jgi:hypothetical protein
MLSLSEPSKPDWRDIACSSHMRTASSSPMAFRLVSKKPQLQGVETGGGGISWLAYGGSEDTVRSGPTRD